MYGPPKSQHGANSMAEADVGLAWRVIRSLFSKMAQAEDDVFLCSCTFLQVYNEHISDLLSPGGAGASPPKIRESREAGIFVDGLREVRLRSAEEALDVLENGTANRKVGRAPRRMASAMPPSLLRCRAQPNFWLTQPLCCAAVRSPIANLFHTPSGPTPFLHSVRSGW